MKRYGYIYGKIYEMDNLRLAFKRASKDKAFYKEVQIISEDPDYYLKQIYYMLKYQTYSLASKDYTMFIKQDKGKKRKIFKLDFFPHRIVQHALLIQIEQYYIRDYIDNTFASIPNRGIHLALSKMGTALKTDVEDTKYCLKMDVRKFYPSINHEVNKKQYRRKFKDKKLLWLIDMIIDSLCLDDDGNKVDEKLVDKEDRKGIAIGSLFSQYDGNFNLSPLDHWLKEVKKVKYLFRYCDDITILGKSKQDLHKLRHEIGQYLKNKLKLDLKDNYQIFNVEERGIDFVGYRHFRNYILLRKSTSKKLIRTMRNIKKRIKINGELNYSDWCSINSYKGWMKWANCYNLYKKWIKPLEPYCRKYYLNNIKKKKKKNKKQYTKNRNKEVDIMANF